MLLFMIILGALMDVGGLAILLPVLMVAADNSLIETNDKVQYVYDSLGFEEPRSFVMFMIVGILVFFVLKNAFTFYISYLQSKFSFRVATDLARRQYLKYYGMGYSYFKETNSADIINNIINIPGFFAQGVLLNLIRLVSEAAVLVFIVVGISMVDVLLFIAIIASLAPAFVILYSATRKKMYRLGQDRKKLYVQAHSRLNQAIFGYADVKLSNKELKFLHSYIDRQGRLHNNGKIGTVLGSLPTKFVEVFAIFGIVVISVYALYFVEDQDQFFAFLGVFAVAAYRVMPSMNRMLSALMGIKNHQFTVEVLRDGELPLEEPELIVNPVPFKQEIEFRDLRFAYEEGGKPALNGVSFTVKKGEKIGIIGESGSGKTTLMNILLRFFTEDSGGIWVDGKKLTEEETNGWRKLIGYVQQDVYLMDGSLKDNIAFGDEGAEVNEERLRTSIERASLKRFVEELPQGWDTPVGEMGAKLSGGQKQRIGIARALYKEAEVLVFDEATSALDMETERAITESIDRLSDGDKTIFVIAHRITTLKSCDRILELREGELVGFYDYEALASERL